MRNFRLVTAAVFTALSLSLISCEQAGRMAPPTSAAGADRSTPSSSHYAYVSDNLKPGHVYVYALPLTPSSQPRWDILTSDTTGDVAFGPDQVYVVYGGLFGSQGEGIFVYEPTKKGAISFVLTVPANGVLAVDRAHDLFQGQTFSGASFYAYQVNVFKPPITKHSVPAFTMNTAVNHASLNTRGMTFDRAGNLWIKDDDNQTMDKYVPPFSPSSVPKLTFPKGSTAPFGSLIFDQNDVMYATNGMGIDVYKPPFTKKTAKAFTIPVPAGTNTLAVDSAGRLYVSGVNGDVYVYVPPFSASSAPEVTLPVPGNPGASNITIKP